MSPATIPPALGPSESLQGPSAWAPDGVLPLAHTPFDAVRAAFDRAARARPDAVCETAYLFGGRKVRFRVVGQALAQHFARPFAHLAARQVDGTIPQLAVDLWDEAETGVPHPRDATEEPGERVWSVAGGFATTFAGGRVFRYQHLHAITWLDRRASHIIGWRASASLPIHERSKPLPLLLPIWYYDRDIHVVHAGLVAKRADGVLIGGRSTTGKTTTSLAALLGGFGYLGDDHSGLEVRPDGSFLGHSLYSCARVTAGHLERFSRLLPYAISGEEMSDKELLLLAEILPERVQSLVAIRAIALPTLGGAAQTHVRRATKGQALRRLAPTSIFTPFGPGARGFRRISQLVEAVPSYWLELGSELEDIPRAMTRILTEVRA